MKCSGTANEAIANPTSLARKPIPVDQASGAIGNRAEIYLPDAVYSAIFQFTRFESCQTGALINHQLGSLALKRMEAILRAVGFFIPFAQFHSR